MKVDSRLRLNNNINVTLNSILLIFVSLFGVVSMIAYLVVQADTGMSHGWFSRLGLVFLLCSVIGFLIGGIVITVTYCDKNWIEK
jgi:hypothetical protein